MYHPARPPAKPWRISRNYAYFYPDKMTSTNPDFRATALPSARLTERRDAWKRHNRHYRPDSFGRSWVKQRHKDRVYRREQRKQQRRLNRYLCQPETSEWDQDGSTLRAD